MYFVTTIPLKLESANNEKHKQHEGPINSAFLYVLAFHEAAKGSTSRICFHDLGATWPI